jgi:GT2 family glycosyltransferase
VTDAPRLSIVIVTWNSADTIGACLASVRASRMAGGVDIILFDNASADGTAELVARDFTWVTLVRSTENLGFAKANNRAMAMAPGDLLLLLNPDTVLHDPDAIDGMLRAMEDSSVAMLGPRLVFADGSHQVGDAGWRPSTQNMLAHGLGLAHVWPGLRSLYLVRPDRFRAPLVAVDWVCGACLLVRRSVVAAAGGLDERLFLYAEDVEWGSRLRGLGYEVGYLPQVRVTHLQGRSETQAAGPVSTRWLTSLLDLYARLNGDRWLSLVRFGLALGFLARAAVYGLLGVLRPSRSGTYAARRSALLAYARAAVGAAI